MKKLMGLVLAGLMGFAGVANALPIFSHTDDGFGNYVITVDGTNEPSRFNGFYTLTDYTEFTLISSDIFGGAPVGVFIMDNNGDEILQFSVSTAFTEISGTAIYDTLYTWPYTYSIEPFTYNLTSNDGGEASNVPEPSTLILLGAGLAGLGFTRKLKRS